MLITLNQLRMMLFYLFFKRLISPNATIAPDGMPEAQFTHHELLDLMDSARCFVGDDGSTGVLLQFRESATVLDDQGAPCPAGLYLSDADYPDEGVIPVQCKAHPIPAAVRI